MHRIDGDEKLVYERGQAETWVRVSLVTGPDGRPRVVMEGHNYVYRLETTRLVLTGVTRALRRITPEELMTGTARLGPIGVQVLCHGTGGKAA